MQDRLTGTFDADVVARTGKPMLQEHVPSQMAAGATVYADDHGQNGGMPNRRLERVCNNAGNYFRGMPTRMVRKAYGPLPKVCTRSRCTRSVRISRAGTWRMVVPPSGQPLDRKDQRRRTAADTVGWRSSDGWLIRNNGLPPAVRSALIRKFTHGRASAMLDDCRALYCGESGYDGKFLASTSETSSGPNAMYVPVSDSIRTCKNSRAS